ncbi:MAG: Panacea domain-containing protein [Hydrotalea sp.]|nr:Panacea domain-containing protein [Hydrotalea sp.]
MQQATSGSNMQNKKIYSVIFYIIKTCQDKNYKLGAVRLNKIIWNSDISYLKENGRTITEEKYAKRQYGPVVFSMPSYIRELTLNGYIDFANKISNYGENEYKMTLYSVKNNFTVSLSSNEKQIIDNFINKICNQTAQEASDDTHDNVYELTPDGEEMPLGAYLFAEPAPIDEKDITEAKRTIEQLSIKSNA